MKNNTNLICIENESAFFLYLTELFNSISSLTFKTIPANTTDLACSSSSYCYFFMDFKTAQNQFEHLNTLTESSHHHFTVIYDCPATLSTSELIKLGRLKGYFLADTKPKQFHTGIRLILNREPSLPVNIAYQLIEYYQSLIMRFNEPYSTNLTPREIQVLKYLRDGFSNNQLADELFISEHTVKSHLYRIFKKIKASNRAQAIIWAHKYLP